MTDQAEHPVILVVDDSKVIRRAATKMLGDDYEVKEAVDGVEAWTMVQQDETISVVFTDMQMPEMNGLELLDVIRDSDDEHISSLPVIMITGLDDSEQAKKEVFEHGATDFISKPFDTIDLLSRAKSYARLTRKVVELEKQTGIDRLTGMLNTASLEQQGGKMLSFAHRHRLNLSVIFLEIEDFQDLFLTHGKHIAQQIIVAVARKLAEFMREEDLAARTSVARYALMLSMTNHTNARSVIERLRKTINKMVFDTGKEKIRISLVAGMTSLEGGVDASLDELFMQADEALRMATQRKDTSVVSYMEEREQQPHDVSEQDLQQAFVKVLEGAYDRIPQDQLDQLVLKIRPLLDYVDSQGEARLTASGESN